MRRQYPVLINPWLLIKNYKKTWNYKGFVLYLLCRFEEAIGCIDKALDIDKNFRFAWVNKGFFLYHLDRYEEAISCFDKALAIDKNFYLSWEYKTFVYLFQHNLEAAEACLNSKPALKNEKSIWHQTFRELYIFASKGQCRLFEVLDEELKQFNRQDISTQVSIYVSAGKFFIEYSALTDAETCLKRGLTLQSNNPLLKKLEERLGQAKTKQLTEKSCHSDGSQKTHEVGSPLPIWLYSDPSYLTLVNQLDSTCKNQLTSLLKNFQMQVSKSPKEKSSL